MVYLNDVYQPSVFALAKQGNWRAITYWLNSYLVPQGVYAHVSPPRSGCLQVNIEFPRLPAWQESIGALAERLAKFICHCFWKLNLKTVEGIRIVACFSGESRVVWQRTIRLGTRPNRVRAQQPDRVRDRLKHLAYRKARLKLVRTFLFSGTTASAFVVGCWLGYVDSPPEQTTAAASPVSPTTRPSHVQGALELLPVIQHTAVANPGDPTVTLVFGGDVTLSDAFADLVGQNYDWAFAELEEYRQADVAMINLEGTLTRATDPLPKQFNFRADPESIAILKHGGVDIVSLGNNHAMDYKEPGLMETMNILDQAGIHHVGAGRDITEARRPDILEVKGQRIAYLGYYDSDLHSAGEGVAGTNPSGNERIAEDIRAIRNQVDWIVVNYHWGEELAERPTHWQTDLARFTIDQGADLVVGHHPHVLQGMEVYKGRPIAYSLGNFIFGGNSRSDYDTAVLRVSLRNRQMKVELLPVEVRQYQPKVVTGDRGLEILRQVEARSEMFDQPMGSTMILNTRESIIPTPAETPTAPTGEGVPPADSFINTPGSTRLNATPVDPAFQNPPAQPSPVAPAPESVAPRSETLSFPIAPSPEPVAPTSDTVTLPTLPSMSPGRRTCDTNIPNDRLEPSRKCYAQGGGSQPQPIEGSQSRSIVEPEQLLESAPWAFAGM